MAREFGVCYHPVLFGIEESDKLLVCLYSVKVDWRRIAAYLIYYLAYMPVPLF